MYEAWGLTFTATRDMALKAESFTVPSRPKQRRQCANPSNDFQGCHRDDLHACWDWRASYFTDNVCSIRRALKACCSSPRRNHLGQGFASGSQRRDGIEFNDSTQCCDGCRCHEVMRVVFASVKYQSEVTRAHSGEWLNRLDATRRNQNWPESPAALPHDQGSRPFRVSCLQRGEFIGLAYLKCRGEGSMANLAPMKIRRENDNRFYNWVVKLSTPFKTDGNPLRKQDHDY